MTERKKMGLKLIISGLILIVVYLLAKPELKITQELNMPFKLGEKVNLELYGEYTRLDGAFDNNSQHHIISFIPDSMDAKNYDFEQYILFYTRDKELILEMIVGYRDFKNLDDCNIEKNRFDSKVRTIEGFKEVFSDENGYTLSGLNNRAEYFTSQCRKDGVKSKPKFKYSAYFLIK